LSQSSLTFFAVLGRVYAISHPKIRQAVHQNFPWLVSEEPAIAAKKNNTFGDATSQVTVDSKPE
jgi:hypothetical protein